MPILPIVTGKDAPILHKKTERVKKMTKNLETLIKNMLLTVHNSNGAGIAAPQVNRTERICIAKIGEDFVALVNPEIRWFGKKTGVMEEGCLSLPGLWMDIERPLEIIVNFETLKGKKRELKLEDFDARVVQHEVDHLDGVLITDRAKK